MRIRPKKIAGPLIVMVGLALLASLCKADMISTSGTGMNTKVHIGKLDILVPLNELDVAYLYDVIARRNLIGGETPIAQIWVLQGTLGAVTSLDGQGAPYVGGKIALPNPVPNLAFLGQVKPGFFGGFDWKRGSAIAGFKADMPIF